MYFVLIDFVLLSKASINNKLHSGYRFQNRTWLLLIKHLRLQYFNWSSIIKFTSQNYIPSFIKLFYVVGFSFIHQWDLQFHNPKCSVHLFCGWSKFCFLLTLNLSIFINYHHLPYQFFFNYLTNLIILYLTLLPCVTVS